MARTMMLRALRRSQHRALFGAIMLALVHVALWWVVPISTTFWRVYDLAAITLWSLVAVVIAVRLPAQMKRPAVRELLDQVGSVLRVTTGSRALRIVLRSGDDLVLKVTPRELPRLVGLLHAHSPTAEFSDHAY